MLVLTVTAAFLCYFVSQCLTQSTSIPFNVTPSHRTADFPSNEQEALHRRSYGYIGGGYYPANSSGRAVHFYQQPMYVEKLTPEHVRQPYPLVFIHGGGPTGTNWLNTPDGRKGWASYFLEKGYIIYILDYVWVGRSGFPSDLKIAYEVPLEDAAVFFTGNAERAGTIWPQARYYTQWPGSGTRGDSAFDQLYQGMVGAVPYPADSAALEAVMRAAGATLLDKSGKVFLIAHSLGGTFAWDARPDLVVGIVNLESQAPPYSSIFSPVGPQYAITSTPLTYSPPVTSPSDLVPQTVNAGNFTCAMCQIQATNDTTRPVRKLVRLSAIPQLWLISQAGVHATIDYCSVKFLRQAGVTVNHTYLQDVGIYGNGHFIMMEKNNLEIAAYTDDWIERWAEVYREGCGKE